MATIQVREIPDEAYEVIRRRARAEGRSIQSYMRAQIIEMASDPSKSEAIARIEAILERDGGANISSDEIADHVRAGRR